MTCSISKSNIYKLQIEPFFNKKKNLKFPGSQRKINKNQMQMLLKKIKRSILFDLDWPYAPYTDDRLKFLKKIVTGK